MLVKKYESIKSIMKLLEDENGIKSLVLAMSNTKTGVTVKTKNKVNCFLASDAVTWCCKQYTLTRRVALQLAQTLERLKGIKNTIDDKPFDDKKNMYYTFCL